MNNRFPDKSLSARCGLDSTTRKASWSLNRHMDRRCGKTFEDTLHMFREHNDPNRPMPFMMIATWNDYEEGTQIENGIAQCKHSQSDSFPGGR